jgi:hypothetical protein
MYLKTYAFKVYSFKKKLKYAVFFDLSENRRNKVFKNRAIRKKPALYQLSQEIYIETAFFSF